MNNNTQLTHADHRQSNTRFPLSVIANDMRSPLNVGGLFRLCDALGIHTLYLCGETPAPPNAKINKTARSSEKYVNYESHTSAEKLVSGLKAKGSKIVSLEITSSSIAIDSEEFKYFLNSQKPVCLILGAENTGVNQTLLALSDIAVHIPMYGNNSSMNVITAASIACYEISRNLQAR